MALRDGWLLVEEKDYSSNDRASSPEIDLEQGNKKDDDAAVEARKNDDDEAAPTTAITATKSSKDVAFKLKLKRRDFRIGVGIAAIALLVLMVLYIIFFSSILPARTHRGHGASAHDLV